ncbi:unnamed protein product [Clonostachys byssicola]|uniref:Uncharacterized protein n=1 Tax=Clonostachys byssicola TaxID=160290 RepID=A0A9N9Y178_9HYPO|nr:unnamed protein product [Clonostachys byssicola]
MAANTPPTVLPHASHGGHPTTVGPSLSNNPTITLDQATRKLISIKPPGSTDWHGVCALNCQQTDNFISVEAMRKMGLPVEASGQYKCDWMLNNDGVVRAGTFQAVSGLGVDVAFGVNCLDDYPAPATPISIFATPHSQSNIPLTGLNTTGQPSIDGHPARRESHDRYGNMRNQKQRYQDAPMFLGPYGGHMLWPILGCLALGGFYLWQKTRATR